MVTVPCLVTVAAGVLAPGHLGELTRYLPFELADDVLAGTRTVQRRVRALPSRVGVYFVLALALFPGIGYLRVWGKMTAALEDLGLPRPSEKALRDLRRRLGPAPLKALFEAVAVPLASPRVPGVAYRGLRTVAFGRDWDGRDLADMLGIKPRTMLTQLGQRVCFGFLVKTAKGRYALPEQLSEQATAPASP